MMRGWGDNERSLTEVVRLFNETFPNRQINKSTVSKTIQRFQEIGSVNNRSRSGRSLSASNEFMEGTLNAQMYEGLLVDQIIPAIQNIFPNNFEQIWFQYDGASPHFSAGSRRILNEVVPRRWIGRRRNQNEGGED
ncbi:hypothetical protein X777_05480 [Ooceraea biroi]|uniref:Uncharacterized protein n=1 Tax=Ooceraea biroi TaxID=2015173 RepID=A0A026WFQ1_OOCBI|nr:hypothetical protein X777_05480 [Ooceraea biroi]